MDILVSGAGVAGLSLALDLGNRGHHVTVIERASHFRVNGSPIDIREDAVGIAAQMGVLDRIRENRVDSTERGVFVDGDGEPIGHMFIGAFVGSDDDVEIGREDLANILIDALPATTTIRMRESVDTLTDDGNGVDVRFASGESARFDLVLGADGQHSTVRRLTFGPEQDYARFLGVYTALADLPAEAAPDLLNPVYNYPNHMAGIFRYKDRALAAFSFRSERIDYDYHDLDAQKQILVDAYADHTEWKIPQLLDAVLADPEFYFDSVSQIRMPGWHRGRVALVGDAGYCATPMSGRGTSLALTGAYFLAEELDRAGGDHTLGFERYEARQRPYVEAAQALAEDSGGLTIPATWEAIHARNERIRATALA